MGKGIRLTVLLTTLAGLIIGQGCPGTGTIPLTENSSTAGNSTGNTANTGTSGTHIVDGGGTSTGGQTGIIDVEIDDYAYVPKSVTIVVGATVRWTNRDFTPHTVRSGDPGDSDAGALFDSGALGAGDTFLCTFVTPGTYTYHCQYHYTHAALHGATVIVNTAQD